MKTPNAARDDAARLGPDFFARDVDVAARALIGAVLLVEGVGGVIVETEAYSADDPASHAYNGPTPRNASMFGPPGRAYVYRSYGLHWCLNGVCLPGCAVLVRALEPTAGLSTMAARRDLQDPRRLCAGPGRLCQALGVDRDLDGAPLDAPPFTLLPPASPASVAVGPRIGISRAIALPRRFLLEGSAFLSRPAPASPASRAT